MAYDPGALEAALAAAAGEEPGLIAELRAAFFDSANGHVDALKRAEDANHWIAATRRLRGLAASFGATRVLDAANAAEAAPNDQRALARVERAIEALRDR